MNRSPARTAAALAAAVVLLAGTGCVNTVPAWRQVALPTGHQPLVLATLGDDLLVGTLHAGAPGLLRRSADAVTELPVVPASPYGAEGSWTSLAVAGASIYGIAGKRGGAHGNVRWSAWAPRDGGVAEDDQLFDTFGGWASGGLTAMLARPEPLIVGAWQAEVGFEPAFWRLAGRRWERQEPTASELSSGGTTLRTVTGAALSGDRVVLVGGDVDLASGVVPRPVAWLAQGAGWRPVVLSDAPGRALAVGCDAASCLVVGASIDGRLRAWTLRDGRAEPVRVAGWLVPDTIVVPAPVVHADAAWLAVPHDGVTGVLRVGSGQSVEVGSLPGRASSLAAQGGSLWVALASENADATLWTLALPG